MTAPFRTWTVLPHGKVTEVAPNILTVVGEIHMPTGEFPRRMTVVRLRDRRLVIFSAIALDEEEMRALEDYGAPAFLVVPNAIHRQDARIWKDRYPKIRVIAPHGAKAKVEEIVPVDAVGADFGDPDVRFVEVHGTEGQESALLVTGPDGATLVINDLIGNIHHAHGLGGWLLRLMGFVGETPHIPLPAKSRIVEDRPLVARQLRQWAATPGLKRILVSHGEPIEADPAGVLRALAEGLE